MYCSTCGTQTSPHSPRCERCGAAQAPALLAAAPKTSGMAIAGLVLAFFCSLAGLILSIIALNDIKSSNGTLTGEGLAQAGIIVSIAFMIIGVLVALGGQ